MRFRKRRYHDETCYYERFLKIFINNLLLEYIKNTENLIEYFDKDNEIELPVQDRENPLLWLLDKIIKFIVKLFKGRKK